MAPTTTVAATTSTTATTSTIATTSTATKQPTLPTAAGCYYWQPEDGANRKCKATGDRWKPDDWGKSRGAWDNEANCLDRKDGHNNWCKGTSHWYFKAPLTPTPTENTHRRRRRTRRRRRRNYR
mmetsp:Transcript_64199/g.141476  ORF Transcript_64199/g.141476 Transcript_64199/m.141476 type:complete len:124 (+) Transcript_64199:447-818(+)